MSAPPRRFRHSGRLPSTFLDDSMGAWIQAMKRDKGDEFSFEDWTSRFRGFVDTDRHSSRSWKSLIEAGVDPYELSALLAFGCEFSGNPASELIEDFRSNALKQARDSLKLATRLDADREALGKI